MPFLARPSWFLRRCRSWSLREGEQPWPRRLRWRRILGAGFCALAATYLGLAAGAYWFVHYRRGITEVRFTDVAVPSNWPRYRMLRGMQQIHEAQTLFAESKFREALMYARTGLAQAPADREGRLLLAKLLVGSGQPRAGRLTLMQGLAYHAQDTDYWRVLLELLLQQKEDALVEALARKYLSSQPAGGESIQLLAFAGAMACYFRGEDAAAKAFLARAPGLTSSPHGQLLALKIEYDHGYRELALMQLRTLAAQRPDDPGIHQTLVSWLREAGATDEVRRALLAYQFARPDEIAPRVELLRTQYAAGDRSRAHEMANSLIDAFAANPPVLIAVASVAAEAGDVEAVRRIEQRSPSEAQPTQAFAFLAIEAMLAARDYPSAAAALRAMPSSTTDAGGGVEGLLASLRAITHLGLGEIADARASLAAYLDQPRLRADNVLAVANRLAMLDGTDLARDALKRAVEIDPHYEPALARLVELDLLLNRVDDLAEHARQLSSLRRPSPDLLRVVQHKLATDLFLYSPDNEATLGALQRILTRARSR